MQNPPIKNLVEAKRYLPNANEAKLEKFAPTLGTRVESALVIVKIQNIKNAEMRDD